MSERVQLNVFERLRENSQELYFVAEAGLNHGGSREKALAMVRAAKWAGADAVKFQTFKAEKLAASQKAQLAHTGDTDLQDLFRRLELDYDSFRILFKEAQRLEIDFLSTPFDEDSVDFLDELGVGAFKVASGDITHRPLLERIAVKNKPVFISTGMSSAEEIEQAIDWMFTGHNSQIVLLHCVSAYPPKSEELNMKSVEFLRDRFGLPVGFSDHSVDDMGATIAVALGAQVIERHFMLDTRGDVPDREVSFDTKQLRTHIEELRGIGVMLGERNKFVGEAEGRNKTASRRSLYARRPIAPGETISKDMLYALRPAVGISPEHMNEVVGRSARSSIDADEPVQWDSLG